MKNINIINRKYFDIFIIFILCFIFLQQSPLSLFGNGISRTDSSVFRTIAMQMKSGLIPYKDTFDHKGPLLYLINYIGLILSENHGVWIIELFFLYITLFYLLKISRLINDSLILSYAVLVLTMNQLFEYFPSGNLTEEYAMAFISCSLFIFIDYFINNNVNKKRVFVCGFSFGAVMLLRPNMISVWVVFCIVIAIKQILSKEYKDLLMFIINFIIGFLLVVLPFIIWLLYKGAFKDFIYQYIIFNFLYSTSTERVSLLLRVNCFTHFFLNMPMILSIFGLLFSMKKNIQLNLSYLFFIFLSLIMLSIPGQIYDNYGIALIPIFSFPISLLFNEMIYAKKINFCYSFLIIGLLVGNCANNWYNQTMNLLNDIKNNILVNNKDKEVICDDFSELDNKILNIILDNKNINDCISIFGNKDIYYVKSKLLPASKYSYQYPIAIVDNNILVEYLDDLVINNPRWIVVHNLFDNRIIDFLNNYGYFPLTDSYKLPCLYSNDASLYGILK